MKKLLKLALLWCSAFSELRVHAEDLITSPARCWGAHQLCAIQNLDSEKAIVKSGNTKITLGPQAIVQRVTPSEFRLVNGKVMVSGSKGSEWTSLFAKVKCIDRCLMIMERESDTTRVLALEGNLQVKRLGDKANYDVPEGFWVRAGNVEADGKGIMDFAQSLPLQPTLKEIAELYDGNFSQFQAEAYRLAPLWTKAVEIASTWHIGYIHRSIAAYEAEQARLLSERLKLERENSRLRAIFRQRNYFK